MHKNYLFWKHLTNDLSQKIKDRKIKEIYSQNKDELILRFYELESQQINGLKISILPGSEYILTENSSPPKRNSVRLFHHLFDENVKDIKILAGRRIIKIDFTSGEKSLWIIPFGRLANIVYKENDHIIYFKKKEAIQPWTEGPNDIWRMFVENKQYLTPNTRYREAVSHYRILNKKLYQEAIDRYKKTNIDSFSKVLKMCLQSASEEPVYRIYYDEDYRACLTLIPLQQFTGQNYEEYKSPTEALKAFLYFFKYRNQLQLQKDSLLVEAKRGKEQLEKMLKSIESLNYDESKKADFKQKADLLKTNIYRLKKGMEEIEVDNIFSPDLGKVIIRLKKNLSPDENAAYYYNKIKSFDKNKRILEHRINNLKKKIIEKERFIVSLNSETDFRKINKLIMNMLDKKNSNGSDTNNKSHPGIRKYEHPDGWQILVGKDDRVNDQLTFKIARNKDIWLHAHGVPGSHVVIFNRGKNMEVPKAIIKEAAQYAAYFSKAKNAGTVPVIYTEVRYVRKPKGAKPGTVTCQREKTVFVKPLPMP